MFFELTNFFAREKDFMAVWEELVAVLFNCCYGMVLNELVRLRWIITTIDNRQCRHDVDILFYELIGVEEVILRCQILKDSSDSNGSH